MKARPGVSKEKQMDVAVVSLRFFSPSRAMNVIQFNWTVSHGLGISDQEACRVELENGKPVDAVKQLAAQT